MVRLFPCLVLLLCSACAALPIRDPVSLEHYQARLRTADGWQLSLFRLPPAATARDLPHFGVPVLLVHGTAINRYNFMLPGSNLAQYLSQSGFDVWLPELRGDRSSRAPDRRTWRRGQWTLEDMVDHDIPAVLDHVLAESGAERVWWIGHSLGGILGYLSLQHSRADDIAGIIAIGSPGAFEQPSRLLQRAAQAAAGLPRRGQFSTRGAGRLLAPLAHVAPDNNLLHGIVNHQNVDLADMTGMVNEAMENVSMATVRQYISWLESGVLTSADGSRNYSDGLAQIQVPALLVAGRVDHIVPPWTVRAGYQLLGSEDKSFVVLGRGWGTQYDYGHGDLLVGSRVEEELFPLLGQWLRARATGRGGPKGALEVLVSERQDPLLQAEELADEPETGERSDGPEVDQ